MFLNANCATRIEISRDELGGGGNACSSWSGRKNAFPSFPRPDAMSPYYMCLDSDIPRKRWPEMLLSLGEMEGVCSALRPTCFMPGDGNLHRLFLFDANDADEMRRASCSAPTLLETSIKARRHGHRSNTAVVVRN